MGYSQTYTQKAIIAIIGMLTFGTGTMVTSKIMLSLEACWPATSFIKSVTRGDDCTVTHPFEKPWFQTAVMFVGMAFCLLIFFVMKIFKTKKYDAYVSTHRISNKMTEQNSSEEGNGSSTSSDDIGGDANEQLIQGSGSGKKDELTEEQLQRLKTYKDFVWSCSEQWKDYLKVGIPACFDMVATAVMTYGLVYISVSVMQMLRGSMTLFSTLFSICFFKRHVHAYQWIAIGMVIIACLLVGIACIKGTEGTSTSTAGETILGCVLVIISQFIQAGQIVVESFLLENIVFPPLIIVGFEGVWGFCVTFILMFILQFIPGGDDGSIENTATSFYMLGNNPAIIGATVIYWFCITFLNWSGMTLTRELGPVVRTIWEAVRTAAIWVVDLFIYYVVVPHSVFGESWNGWSFMQLFGFGILVWGSFTNNAMVKYPGLYYPPAYLIGKKRPDKKVVSDYMTRVGKGEDSSVEN